MRLVPQRIVEEEAEAAREFRRLLLERMDFVGTDLEDLRPQPGHLFAELGHQRGRQLHALLVRCDTDVFIAFERRIDVQTITLFARRADRRKRRQHLVRALGQRALVAIKLVDRGHRLVVRRRPSLG